MNASEKKKKNFLKESVKIVSRLKSCLQQRNGLLVVTMKQLRQRLRLQYCLSKILSCQTMINYNL